jgi:hypothetical protein
MTGIDEILVTAPRLSDDASSSGSGFFVPRFMADPVRLGGAGSGGTSSQSTTVISQGSKIIIQIAEYDFKFEISGMDWAKFTPVQQAGLMEVLMDYAKSNELRAALQHLETEHIGKIVIRVSDQAVDHAGKNVNWLSSDVVAQIAQSYDLNDPRQVDLVANTDVVITFREKLLSQWGPTAKDAGEVSIHELLHPVTSNLLGDVAEHDSMLAPV